MRFCIEIALLFWCWELSEEKYLAGGLILLGWHENCLSYIHEKERMESCEGMAGKCRPSANCIKQ